METGQLKEGKVEKSTKFPPPAVPETGRAEADISRDWLWNGKNLAHGSLARHGLSPAGLQASPYHSPGWTLPFLETDKPKPTFLSAKIPLGQQHSSTVSAEEPESSSPPAVCEQASHSSPTGSGQTYHGPGVSNGPPHQDHIQVGECQRVHPPPTPSLSSMPPPKRDARNRNPTDLSPPFPGQWPTVISGSQGLSLALESLQVQERLVQRLS